MKRIDIKYLLLLLALLLVAGIFYKYPSAFLSTIIDFFEIPDLILWSGILATIIVLVHKIKEGQLRFTVKMSLDDFKTTFEELISFRYSPVTLACSLAFAKALILQHFGRLVYFIHFTDLEMDFIVFLTCYCLFISVMEITKKLNEIITLPSGATAKAADLIPQPSTGRRNDNQVNAEREDREHPHSSKKVD